MSFAKIAQELAALPIIAAVTFGIVALLGICQIFVWRRRKREDRILLAATEEEYRRWRNDLAADKKLSPIPTTLCLAEDEHCYYQTSATLIEPKSVRDTVHIGGAAHIAKGVAVGGGNSHSESHDEWRELSTGTLCVTNKRIIFDGDMHNRTVKLSSLISVCAEPRQVAVSTSGNKKTMLFSNLNGKIAGEVIRIVRNSAR